jgi:Cytochrome c7 and related cytochrome c/Class III cytochrome C family
MRRLKAVLMVAAAAVAALLLLGEAPAPAEGPRQPFRFSHRVHAGEARIGCTSCHVYAERGPVAGVPSMARCNGCHKFVKEDPKNQELDQELKALRAVLDEGKPVQWVRVHRVPDHVFFPHQRHVVTAKLECRQCHGEIEKMDVVRQVSPLTMGWCLECHQAKKGPTDCWACHK